MMYPNREVETQKLKDLAVTTPFSLSELRATKKDFNLTDAGVEQAVAEALKTGRHPSEIALSWLNVEYQLQNE